MARDERRRRPRDEEPEPVQAQQDGDEGADEEGPDDIDEAIEDLARALAKLDAKDASPHLANRILRTTIIPILQDTLRRCRADERLIDDVFDFVGETDEALKELMETHPLSPAAVQVLARIRQAAAEMLDDGEDDDDEDEDGESTN